MNKKIHLWTNWDGSDPDITIGWVVGMVLVHPISVLTLTLLTWGGGDSSFTEAFDFSLKMIGAYCLYMYNFAFHIFFIVYSFKWMTYPIHRGYLPSLWYTLVIPICIYFLYCFVHLVMIRDLTVAPSWDDFWISYFNWWSFPKWRSYS